MYVHRSWRVNGRVLTHVRSSWRQPSGTSRPDLDRYIYTCIYMYIHCGCLLFTCSYKYVQPWAYVHVYYTFHRVLHCADVQWEGEGCDCWQTGGKESEGTRKGIHIIAQHGVYIATIVYTNVYQGCESFGFYPNNRILRWHSSYSDGFCVSVLHLRILLRGQPRPNICGAH